MAESTPTDNPDASSPDLSSRPVRNEVLSDGKPAKRDRSLLRLLWYYCVQNALGTIMATWGGWRATGRENVPESGGALLVSNHLSYLDVLALGVSSRRPLNYVARSTLFVPGLGFLIRSVGGFPIQREGMGASGLKETLRRLKQGGIVTLFPEGTRSRDGALGPINPGIAWLVARAEVPVVPVGIAGTFESWPRTRPFPTPHPVRVHFGRTISPEEVRNLDQHAIRTLVGERIAESVRLAKARLDSDLDLSSTSSGD